MHEPEEEAHAVHCDPTPEVQQAPDLHIPDAQSVLATQTLPAPRADTHPFVLIQLMYTWGYVHRTAVHDPVPLPHVEQDADVMDAAQQ